MAHHEPIRRTSSNPDIPDKLYFRIGEVAKLCEVPAYVLRFWEREFPQLKPNKGGTGQRLYRRRDVETAIRIKVLLYDEAYTIPGARQVLKQEQRHTGGPQLALAIQPAPPSSTIHAGRLRLLRKELRELHALLSSPVDHNETPKVQAIRSVRTPRMSQSLVLTRKSTVVGTDDLFVSASSSSVSEDRLPRQ